MMSNKDEPDWTDFIVKCDNCGHTIHVKRIDAKPCADSKPIWGLPVSADRPLADEEIISRLRDIQRQIAGGSYAIDRLIEFIKTVTKRTLVEDYNEE